MLHYFPFGYHNAKAPAYTGAFAKKGVQLTRFAFPSRFRSGGLR